MRGKKVQGYEDVGGREGIDEIPEVRVNWICYSAFFLPHLSE